MTIQTVEGVVLHETNYSETSKILNVLTKEYGIIGILSKGCRSLKSKLRSVSTKLTYGSFHIYYKENGLSTLIGVDVKNSFRTLKMDLKKISYATFLLDLVSQVSKQTEENLYDSLTAILEKIEEGFDPLILTTILELKLLDSLGVKPMVDGCAYCGNDKRIVTFHSGAGGYVCEDCYQNEKIYSDKAIKLLRLFYYVDVRKISKLEVSPQVMAEIVEFVDDYYDRYTGLFLKSKKFLQELNKVC